MSSIVNKQSLHRRHRRQSSPTAVIEDIIAHEMNRVRTDIEANVGTTFKGQLNDADDVEIKEIEDLTRSERRRAALRTLPRPRPDSKGRINGKECHSFAFASLFFDE
jgi:hypothetical protein